ncbi:hypothetical protein CSUI_008239, partial [Cystoisospora suis]
NRTIVCGDIGKYQKKTERRSERHEVFQVKKLVQRERHFQWANAERGRTV